MGLQTLGSLGGARRAIPLLVALVKDASPLVRAQAATTLVESGAAAHRILPALTTLLDDPEGPVRDSAAWALARLGSSARGSIDALVRSLRAAPDRRCSAAASTLAAIGEPAVSALIRLLESDDPALRQAVLEGLSNSVQAGLWQPTLGEALEPHYATLARDREPSVRIALGRMLVVTRSDSPPARRALGDLLCHSGAKVRLAVLRAAGSLDEPPIVPLAPLVELLKDRDVRVRALAARIIRQRDLGEPEVIDALLAALQDPDADVRAAAAERLAVAVRRLDARDLMGRPAPWIATCFAAAGQPAAGGVLRSVLDDPDARVRAAGAEIVTAFPDEADRSIPLLIDRLRDPAASVRSAAAEALAQFGEKSRPALRLLLAILADPEVRGEHDQRASRSVAMALIAIGRDSKAKMLRVLLEQLNSLDENVRERARQVFTGLGTRLVDDLMQTLSDPKTPRQVHVEILRVVREIVSQNGGTKISVSESAARAVAPVLRSLVREPDPEVQIMALAMLADVAPQVDDAAEAFLDHARAGENPDHEDHWLGLAGQPAMIPRLIKALREEEATVRVAVVRVLLSLAEHLADAEREDSGGQARRQLARAALDRLRDPDSRVRWCSTEILGVLHLDAKAVVPILIAMARTEKGRVPAEDAAIRSFEEAGQPYVLGPSKKAGDPLRIAAIQALGGFGPEAAEAVPELIRSLRDPDRRVRWFAAEALCLIGPEAKAAVPALIEAFRSPDVALGDTGKDGEEIADAPIRLMAAMALGKIGPDAGAAIPELIAALAGPDSRVRSEAAQALGQIGPAARDALPHLIRFAARETESEGVEYAKQSVKALGADARPGLARALVDADSAVRLAAIEVLGEVEVPAAVPIPEVVRCVGDSDPEVRKATILILPSLRDDPATAAAIPRLVIALGDEDDETSDAARNALSAIVTPALSTSLPMLPAALTRLIAPSDPISWTIIPLGP